MHDAYAAGEGGNTTKTAYVTEMGWRTDWISRGTHIAQCVAPFFL
jgi:hypothetical protein